MAGAGYKSFTSGDVLTASQVNTYLMDQAVMTFASSAARGSAIASPSEGMSTYLSDANRMEIYDGATWKTVAQAISQQILQVVVGSTSAQVQSSTTAYADTGVTATITPTSTSSKVLVIVSHNMLKLAGNALSAVDLRLFRGATGISDSNLNLYTGSSLANYLGGATMVYLDNPATTSATTYKTQFKNYVAASLVAMQPNGASTLLLIEVSG